MISPNERLIFKADQLRHEESRHRRVSIPSFQLLWTVHMAAIQLLGPPLASFNDREKRWPKSARNHPLTELKPLCLTRAVSSATP